MTKLALVVSFCLSALPAFAEPYPHPSPCAASACYHRSAPAPLIGLGVPVAIAVGGVLLGAKLLGRNRQP